MIKRLQNYKWYGVAALGAATLFVFYYITVESNRLLTVSFLDVDQGDAIFIEAPNGNQILIDGGPPNGKVLRGLRKQMPFYDRSIDVVMATHPDQDHIGGLVDVLERYQVGLVIDSGVPNTTKVYKEKENILAQDEIHTIEGKRGTVLTLDEDLTLEILFPDRDLTETDPNSASLVARLVYGEHEFLLTGDAPKSVENYVATLGNIESDVLKVGHHGSKTSTDVLLLGYVKPQFAVISAGGDNRYGHPHKEVTDRLEEFGVTTLITSELGTITFTSDGRDLKIK
ncbi:MBL fold metallo-hydrolase [bacterium]|nr:MBL fold metallo-hydrolase [bacterium]|tara:strand:+ start:395 stop:1246 length:852 start_codon:yes stop_codon:yes gene_type:complete